MKCGGPYATFGVVIGQMTDASTSAVIICDLSHDRARIVQRLFHKTSPYIHRPKLKAKIAINTTQATNDEV